MGPDVHDLVVALAVGDNTLLILCLNFGDLLMRGFDFACLRFRNDHVSHADGNTGQRGVLEA